MSEIPTAPVDHRTEAIRLLGTIFKLHYPDSNVIKIDTDFGDRDIAIITKFCPIRGTQYTQEVSIAGDSVLQAIKDIIEKI